MNTVIIVRIRDGYQPQEGTPFDAVVSALNHFEIESVVSKAEGDELVEASRAAAWVAAEYLEAQRVIQAGPPRPNSGFAPPRSWRHNDPEVIRFHKAVAALNALAAEVR